jgi:hypothetical protein
MQPEEDEHPLHTSMDLVFEAMARLAGTLEAEKTARRSARRDFARRTDEAREKKSSTALDALYDNTNLGVVTKNNIGGAQS